MATTLDRAVIIKKESTFGTYPTVDRALEYLDGDTSINAKPNIYVGQGLRAGALLPDGSRRVITKYNTEGSLGVECLAKGQGTLWEILMGSGASNLVSTGVYQQVFTMAAQIPPFSIQEQWFLVGTDLVDTFTAATYTTYGAMVTDWELSMTEDVAVLKVNFAGRKTDTAQSAVAVTLPSTATQPLSRANLSFSTGTLTAATTTALASATTAVTGFDSIAVKVNNNLNLDRPGSSGLRGKPVPAGPREIEVTISGLEHRDATFETARDAQTAVSFLTDYTGLALTSGTEHLQVAIADLRVDDLTKKVENGVPKLDLTLKGQQATTPMQIIIRTADSAL